MRLVPRPDAHHHLHRRPDHRRRGPARNARQAAHRLLGVEAHMNAYKFLRSDGTGVFTRFAWPLPHDGPGAWVETTPDPCRAGIHACRLSDLPYWAGRALYEIELSGDVVEHKTKVVAPRGPLLRRIDTWDCACRASDTCHCAGCAHEIARENGIERSEEVI